ncbi:class I SAM-dependent methyltransferase [Mangrovimonas sp. CR14]|uniref:class I SAM-dependent methyltransferase n=1 Tax=Mangrovimonas sp. CR14 TaxID=2706120 RepID=UPI0014205C18|nr:class I SAM-dependent methyltransferase [Mangrovimonas sp. CR14]NIK90898.1 class I SAM-dependent methyltransferase [Mangrovimonas sp. CR14]
MKSNPQSPLKVKDHSVSQEEFTLEYDAHYDMLVTKPQPKIEELGRYYESEDYISHTDSKRNLFEKVYHLVREYSLKKKVALINEHHNSDKKLLDIGCGTGDFLNTAKKYQWDVYGVEPNQQARSIAQNKIGKELFETLEKVQEKEAGFDVITLWHVLEHLPNLDLQWKQFNLLLKDEGTLIIAVPNFKSFDAKHYKQFWAAYDVPRHLWHFSKTSIAQWAKENHMQVTEIHPMKFDSYYVSLLSEKYVTGSSNPIKAFWTGFKSNRKARSSKEYSSLIYVLKKTNYPK